MITLQPRAANLVQIGKEHQVEVSYRRLQVVRVKLQVPVRLRSRQALPYATSNFLSSLVTGALRAVLCTENRIRCVGQYRDAGDPSPRQRDDKVEGRGTPWRGYG